MKRTQSATPRSHPPSTGSRSLANGKMRILIGADTYAPDVNGAARFTHNLAMGMVQRGHEVHVTSPSLDGPSESVLEDGVWVHRLSSLHTPFHPTLRFCRPWQVGAEIRALMDEINPDLAHIQSQWTVARGVARTAAKRGIPVMATNHFMPENVLHYVKVPRGFRTVSSKLLWRDALKVYQQVDLVTAPTPRAVQLLTDNGYSDRAMPVSCGIDLARFDRPVRRKRDGERTVLFVGRLDEEKRIDDLVRAVARLGSKVRLEIVGAGSQREPLAALAESLGIADRVVLRGFVSDEELPDAYAGADVFCMPSVAELQSIVTMEAMAAGKPIIAADAMALPHLVRPGHNGWLHQPGDVAEIATLLSGLLGDQESIDRMGAASREMVSVHAIDTTLRTFEDLYRELTQSTDVPQTAGIAA